MGFCFVSLGSKVAYTGERVNNTEVRFSKGEPLRAYSIIKYNILTCLVTTCIDSTTHPLALCNLTQVISPLPTIINNFKEAEKPVLSYNA